MPSVCHFHHSHMGFLEVHKQVVASVNLVLEGGSKRPSGLAAVSEGPRHTL